VGTAGGTVSLPSGPAVVVPAGSLPANTTLTVAASTGAAPAGAIGSVYEFGPSGTTFATPVTVRFPVPAGTVASTIAVYWTKPGSTTQWDTLTATVSGTTATASVTHFSQGYVGLLPNQCIDLTGAWTFTQHCASNYLGKQLVITQAGCTISTTEPVTGQPLTGTVVGNTFDAGNCPATVTGDTMNIQCSGCPQIAVRQACTAGLTCTPPGTADPCKTYATTCGTGGAQACGVSGNAADGTTCGSGLTCSAGTCVSSGPPADYVPVAISRRYFVTPTGSAGYVQRDQATLFALPNFSRATYSSNVFGYGQTAFTLTGGALFQASTTSYSDAGAVLSTTSYSPPGLIFPADTTPGATASSTSTASSGGATFTVTRALTVNGIESVTVPAGTFSALKVTTYITQSNAAPAYFVAWWAPGVGRVKSIIYPAATPTSTTTWTLTGYSPMACAGGTCECNALVNAAPLVDPAYVASGVPAATGGTILDGTYFATANRVYTGVGGTAGPAGGPVKNTYSIQSGLLNSVTWHTGLTADVRGTGFLSVSGNQLTLTPTCGNELPGTVGFTASGSTIQMIITNSCPGSACDPGADAVLTRQ
jgi:hypothetical protein